MTLPDDLLNEQTCNKADCNSTFDNLIVGAISAKRMQLPMVLFVITGIIPIVPGTAVYQTVVFFNQGDVLGVLQNAIDAAFGIGAIAAGVGAGRIITDPEWGFERN